MSHDLVRIDSAEDAQANIVEEARRQMRVCNACRYCEGYCAVFPSMTKLRDFSDGDLLHLANLCHNCRGCYYSCQYTAPHAFDLNVPAALGALRQQSWEDFVRPRSLSRAFSSHGTMIVVLAVLATFLIALAARPGAATASFYAYMPHWLMVTIFLPVFLAPLVVIGDALRRYWRATAGPATVGWRAFARATWSVVWMRNLSGGDGQGCNFERGERTSQARRLAHQAVMFGFLLCFAATSVATMMDYVLQQPAPYPLLSPPRLLGIAGGVLLVAGTVALVPLKLRADRSLGAPWVWGGEMAFILLLGLVGATGLGLAMVDGSAATRPALVVHLGLVATLFLLMPYSKMVHGFFRLTALIVEEARRHGG